MRWLLAMIKHETNTFSPVPTPLERFFRGSPEILAGERALRAYENTDSGLGGYIEVARREGAEIVIPVAAESWPSAPTDAGTYERLSELILDEVRRGGYDAILLDLHGAMVAEGIEDAEGHLLRRLREIDPHTPVGVTLDMHANIYDDIVRHATVITGFHTYPHVDIRASGVRAADVIARTIKGEIRPVMAWANKPMLPHIMRQGTHADPNKSLQDRCRALESQGILAASVFVGFPHADIREAGLSAVICTDADSAAAERYRDELLQAAWQAREQWVFHCEPLEPAIARAKRIEQGPVILLDHFDNTGSGGTMDTTAVLAEILRQELDNVAFYAICDPQAARQAAAAGVGADITLEIGGKVPMPALKEQSPPLSVSGRVKLVFDGVYLNRGPMYRGVRNDTGLTVVFDTGRVQIVIVSRHQEPFDINCLLSAGIDPMQKRYVALKSRVHWRAGFADMATEIIECTGVGVTTSDYSQVEFKNVRRPIYPLDPL
ncbi:microcystin degradation protein MlrC [Bordetella genomosp. 7]|uniref:Microcystinase C n=1 Tax=Bordetella genomosp. 7 TaxID=1416805 RepID=A0A261QYY4_9BORD|nr:MULTISPECIES: M81 family metallopeptidase [Bordetella]OZI17303.1 microcystin degradation protein MlrC [Bordetella genomosp. 7]OZI17458.1 microcystin degradation protein MlrC [Bordetella genomosp. 7]